MTENTFSPWINRDGKRSKTSAANWRKPRKWNRDAAAFFPQRHSFVAWCDDSDGGGPECQLCHAPQLGHDRPRVFCASLADVFEDWDGPILDHKRHRLWRQRRLDYGYTPDDGSQDFAYGRRHITMNDLRRDLFALIDQTPNLDWILLTKRPENVRRMWPWRENADTPSEIVAYHVATAGLSDGIDDDDCQYRPNVHLLTSVSDQTTADKQITELLKLRDLVPVLGLSYEPLLGPLQLRGEGCVWCYNEGVVPGVPILPCRACLALDWVIVGGESGPNARPCNIEWIRSIRDQCAAAGVACFVKQLGAHVIDRESTVAHRCPDERCWPAGFRQDGQRIILNDSKGGDWDEWPQDLRVRQMPNGVGVPT